MCPPCVLRLLVRLLKNCSRAGFPQVFDNYAVTVMIGEDPYTLGLFDTAGASAYIYHFNFAPNRASPI